MTEKQTFLTPQGFARLQAELEYLRTVRRRQVAEHIRIAKEDGDITENAGYEEAKKEQAFLEGRIMTIENMLRHAVIIEHEGPTDTVRLGSWVTIKDEEGNQETYHIVGSAEANPSQGTVSNESPLGRALMGKSVGEQVTVESPAGPWQVRIVRIQ